MPYIPRTVSHDVLEILEIPKEFSVKILQIPGMFCGWESLTHCAINS